MDKNSITGFVLIAMVLFGFTYYQARQTKAQLAEQAQLDSIAAVEAAKAAEYASTLQPVVTTTDSLTSETVAAIPSSIYKDSLLEASHSRAEQFVRLANDKLELVLTTRGAQPYSVKLNDYKAYASDELYLIKPGSSEYSFSIYAGQNIKTSDFSFDVVSKTDTSAVMRLAFVGGGYIEQSYSLHKDSYSVDNKLSFVGMQGIVPKNVSMMDMDFTAVIPRLEKGYKNESMYSMVNWYFDGDKKPEDMGRGRNGSKRIDSRLSWFAFHQQFFSAILRAPQEFASGDLAVTFGQDGNEDGTLMTCSANMRCDIKMDEKVEVPFEFYFGPNHYQTLKALDHKYEKTIPLGGWLVGWFTRFVIIPLFNILHKFIGNFGIIILLMTLIIKIVVMPLTNKSFLSSAKMSALKPEMDKINAKYPKQEDAMKKQQATMELYRKAGISPMGGCLPTLLTFPILWAMFRFFPASIELRQQPFLWCNDLSSYDSIIDYGTKIPILGDHLSLFALLMAVTMWGYSKMTMQSQPMNSDDPNAMTMRFMTLWMMPIMMFFICNNISAALSYYYLLSQLFSIAQNFILRKFFVNKEAILAKVKAADSKPVQKSKWQLRLEEAQRMQQQQMREQQNRRK